MKIRSRFTRFAPLLIFLFFSGLGQADAGFLDLNSLQQGEIVTIQIPDGTISANNLTELGNLLTITGNDTDIKNNLTGGLISEEGSNPTGTITFDFNIPNLSFGIDLVDIEQSSTDYAGTFVEFFDRGSSIGTMGFNGLKSHSSAESPYYTGNNSLNRIEPFTVSELNSLSNTSITSFDKVVISMGGSGRGISDDWVPPVPKPTTMQPTTMLLFGFGLVGVGGFAGFRRKFRKV